MTCPLQPKSKRTSADALPNPLSNYFRLNFLMRFHTLLQSPNLLISSECSVSLSKPNCQIWACLPSSAHKISELLLYLWHSANNRKLLAFFFFAKMGWKQMLLNWWFQFLQVFRAYLHKHKNTLKTTMDWTCTLIFLMLKDSVVQNPWWTFSLWLLIGATFTSYIAVVNNVVR